MAHVRYKAAGQVLRWEDDLCRTCGQTPTHYLIRPLDPAHWAVKHEAAIVAVPYCDRCSPVIESVTPEAPVPVWKHVVARLLGLRAA